MKLNILIVEDEPPIANEVRFLLEDEGHQVLKIAYDAESALDFLFKEKVDLIFLDIAIRGQRNGIEIAEIVNLKYNTPFIFLTSFADSETLSKATATKPCAYIVKPFKDVDILAAINIGMINWEQREKKNNILNLKQLNGLSAGQVTDKEYKIILNVLDGMTNQQISEVSGLSPNTIKWYIQRIFSKLNVKNRSSLIKMVYQSNL